MKKVIFAIVTFFAAVTWSYAANGCGDLVDPLDPSKGVIVCESTPITQQTSMPWGMGNWQLVTAGTVVIDEAGVKDVCPTFYGKIGCVDIYRTDYYRNKQRETAKWLQSRGSLQYFPTYTYWVTH